MSDPAESPRIFISVAELSADEHAAALVEAFLKTVPTARFEGLVGPALREHGCECFADLTARSAMAAAALWRVPAAWRLLRRVKKYLADRRFDAAVLVDSPALNLPIAELCRRAGVPVLYYVAPQTWAWGPRRWRNARIKKRVSRLACIWPFEEAYFCAAGIDARYVGHPSFDRLLDNQPDSADVARMRRGRSPVLALLPGSRRHVIDEVFPGQLRIVQALKPELENLGVVIVAADDEARDLISAHLDRAGRLDGARVVSGPRERAAALAAADMALVASGTVTLEVAYRGTPMIVMYNASRWFYQLVGRWLITTPYLSIPNLLAGRQIVPEFMPYYRSVDPIVETARQWLASPEKLASIRRELLDATAPIAVAGAAGRTTQMLTELIDRRRSQRGD